MSHRAPAPAEVTLKRQLQRDRGNGPPWHSPGQLGSCAEPASKAAAGQSQEFNERVPMRLRIRLGHAVTIPTLKAAPGSPHGLGQPHQHAARAGGQQLPVHLRCWGPAALATDEGKKAGKCTPSSALLSPACGRPPAGQGVAPPEVPPSTDQASPGGHALWHQGRHMDLLPISQLITVVTNCY